MMRNYTILFCLAFCLMIMSSCNRDKNCVEGQGSIQSEILYTGSFTGVKAKGSMDIRIEEGDEFEVRAIGHPNIIDRLMTDVDDDILEIDLQNDCYKDYELGIEITMPMVEKLILDGSGSINVLAMENESDLTVELKGSGDIDLHSMEGTMNLDVSIDGSGQVDAHGPFSSLLNLDVEIAGSGDYKGFGVAAQNCLVTIDGSGDCRLTAIENLDVLIQGSGDVHYKGNPDIDFTSSGSGSLINAN